MFKVMTKKLPRRLADMPHCYVHSLTRHLQNTNCIRKPSRRTELSVVCTPGPEVAKTPPRTFASSTRGRTLRFCASVSAVWS